MYKYIVKNKINNGDNVNKYLKILIEIHNCETLQKYFTMEEKKMKSEA